MTKGKRMQTFLLIPSKIQLKNWYCKRRVTKFYTASVDYCENAKLLWSFVNNSIAHSVITFSFHLKLHSLCETLRLTTFYSNSVNPKTSICRPGLPKKLQLNALRYQKNFLSVPNLFADNPRTWMFSNRPQKSYFIEKHFQSLNLLLVKLCRRASKARRLNLI